MSIAQGMAHLEAIFINKLKKMKIEIFTGIHVIYQK